MKMSVRAVETWTKKGILPSYKVNGGTVRYKWREVEAALEAKCRKG
jgi:hypothetical protein